MDKIFLTVLNMSFTSAFIIAAICLARLPLKKAPKIISYCLWAVAGFRLVFPLSIESIFSLVPFNAQPIPTDIAFQARPYVDSGVMFVDDLINTLLPVSIIELGITKNPLQSWIAIGSVIWVIGIGIMIVYGLMSYAFLKGKMLSAVCVDGNIYEADIDTPYALGVRSPNIYIPLTLPCNERKYIILHEQVHIRRRDHSIKFVSYFILCLHWFNPFVWIAFILMSADMEMSCDESVLREMGMNMKKEYSLLLLSLAMGKRFIGTSPLAFSEGGVKERVKNVLSFKNHSKIIVLLEIIAVTVLSSGFALSRVTAETPTYALTTQDAYWIASDHFYNNPNFEEVLYMTYSGVNVIAEWHKPLITGYRFEVYFSTGEVIFCYVAKNSGAIFYNDLNGEWVEIMPIENN
jgi:beta-lactamase regulating signal transducer with metallopeptidase domain